MELLKKTDFARSEAWVCPPFPVPVKSSNFFLVAGTAVRNNNRKISKEHEQRGLSLCIVHHNTEDGILFQFSLIYGKNNDKTLMTM